MRLLSRRDAISDPGDVDVVRQRRRQLGLAYMLVPAVILLAFAVAEGVGGETGWWGHLVQLVPILGLTLVAWVRPLIGGPVLLAGAVGLATWLLVAAEEPSDAVGAIVLLCGPMLVAGGFFTTAGSPEE